MAESSTIAEEMDDNQALREILGEVRLLGGIIREQYDDVLKQEGPVSAEAPVTRNVPATVTVIKTLVTNTLANPVLIYEDDALVKRLPGNETWVSPLSGSGKLVVSADVGFASNIVIATYVKG